MQQKTVPDFPILYPHASSQCSDQSNAREPFQGLRPLGVTIHYTADRKLDRVIQTLRERHLAYHLIIDRGGEVIQMAPLTWATNHAGHANWNGNSPNRTHVSVAMVCWGELKFVPSKGFLAWNSTQIIAGDVRTRPVATGGGEVPRYWDMCTDIQEAAMTRFLKWCVAQGIKPADVCGHDECALPLGRKSDPGGSLSMSMQYLRDTLKNAELLG